ncbi:hypothetical protein F5Y18DRAFT_400662 [Xylariaceae sp. FL1019]|nr:hypothetical protein F5Y18DRAFT_400662 [Xylariaceae sp. FL1019]
MARRGSNSYDSKSEFESSFNDEKPEDHCSEEHLYDGNLHPLKYYEQAMQEFDEEQYDRKEYALGTEALVTLAERQWESFANKVLRKKDWKQAFHDITFTIVYHFLNWHLGQRTTEGGKKKRKMNKRSALVTLWCTFRLAFERSTTFKIDRLVNHQRLANACGTRQQGWLDNEKRQNRSMTLSDLNFK